MLDTDSAVPYLVEQGFLSGDAVVDGGVVVHSVPRRNRNLRVTLRDGSGLFLKQPEPTSVLGGRTLRAEGDLYTRLAGTDDPAAVLMPRLVHYEPSAPLLILDLLGDHLTLKDYCVRSPRLQFPIHLWRHLGRGLGRLHHASPDPDGDLPPGAAPWAPTSHEPDPSMLASFSPADLQLFRHLQASEVLLDGLDGHRWIWQASAFIHGDLRAANVLVGTGPDGTGEIRVVDWETHGLGDPAWDVAGVLVTSVLLCLTSLGERVAGTAEGSADERAPGWAVPWLAFQAAHRVFWEEYVATGCDGTSADLPVRAAQGAATRLVQAAWELTHRSAVLSSRALALLGLAESVYADPERAAVELFALT